MYSKIFFAVGLLFSTPVWSAVLPPVASLTIGGQTIISPISSKYKTLSAIGGNSGTTSAGSFRRLNGGSGAYTPSGSLSFRLLFLRCSTDTPTTESIYFGYSDNSILFNGDPATLVNFVSWASDGASSASTFFGGAGTMEIPLGSGFIVPNGKFLSVSGRGGGLISCIAYGQEE